MNIINAETVFETLTGSLEEKYCVPGVENAFAQGRTCERLYAEIYQANCRLCDRLGREEDPDVERIINNYMEIARILSLKMYHYGTKGPAT